MTKDEAHAKLDDLVAGRKDMPVAEIIEALVETGDLTKGGFLMLLLAKKEEECSQD